MPTPQEVIDQYDPDDAARIIMITDQGWFLVPRDLPFWLQNCPQLVELVPLYTMLDPCD